MKDISTSNFGLLIAFALPGFVALWGISGIWPMELGCLIGTDGCTTTITLVGFFNSTIAALAAGMVIGAIRFVLIDTLHALTGLRRPVWNGQAFGSNLEAVKTMVQEHYRFYQFYSGMLIAVLLAYAAHLHRESFTLGIPVLLIALLLAVFWIASRDSLGKYYTGLERLLTHPANGDSSMTNGMSTEHKDPKKKNDGPKVPSSNASQAKPDKPAEASEEDTGSQKR
jgi:hypothetical protein